VGNIEHRTLNFECGQTGAADSKTLEVTAKKSRNTKKRESTEANEVHEAAKAFPNLCSLYFLL
jgi:hypothetical protein